jgi:hypothetical protein
MIELGPGFAITDEAISDARELGFNGDVKKTLLDMVRLSVPFSHLHGNRRYEGWMFLVEGCKLLSVSPAGYDPLKERRTKRKKVRRDYGGGKKLIDLTSNKR